MDHSHPPISISFTSRKTADMSTSNGVGLLSRSNGDNERAHYMLKVESFSLLSEAGIEKFESETFESGDYKWKLVLYPSGNKTDGGKNHISLYLRIVDTKSLPQGWEVNVYFKFYVYDHLRENYVTIQDAERKKIRFHSTKLELGLAKLIPLKIFKDTSSGYLFQDNCVFGVDVFVTPKFVLNDKCLSMMKPPTTNNSYTWTVENFSSLTEGISSEVFKVGKIKWKLRVLPKGCKGGSGTHLSLFLLVADHASLPLSWRIYAKYKLRINDQSGNGHLVDQVTHWFCAEEENWGFPRFISLNDLNDEAKNYVVKDKLIVEVEITALGVIKSFI